MNRNIVFALLAITILGSTLAVGAGTFSDSIHDTTDHSGTGGVDIVPTTNMTPTQNGLSMEAEIHYTLNRGDPRAFEHVMLCLYDENGTSLVTRDIGSFEGTADYTEVEVQTNTTPHYILIDHPEFETIEGFQVDAIVWDDETGRYAEQSTDDIEFQYPRNDTVGECA